MLVSRLFLLVNTFALLVFTFSSVLYFPSVVPDNAVVRQALSQSDPDLRSGDELQQERQAEPAPSVVLANPAGERMEATTTQGVVEQREEHTIATTEDTALPSAQDRTEHLEAMDTQQPADNDSNPTREADGEHQRDSEALIKQNDGVTAATDRVSTSEDQVVVMDVSATTRASSPEEATAVNDADVEKTPIPAETENSGPMIQVAVQPANRIADLIAKMKEKALRSTSSPTDVTVNGRFEDPSVTKNTQHRDGTREAQPSESAQLPRGEIDRQNGPNTRGDDGKRMTVSFVAIFHEADALTRLADPLSCAAIRENLVVWLKADAGVEVEDLKQCQSTGAGTSCDVKSYVHSSVLSCADGDVANVDYHVLQMDKSDHSGRVHPRNKRADTTDVPPQRLRPQRPTRSLLLLPTCQQEPQAPRVYDTLLCALTGAD